MSLHIGSKIKRILNLHNVKYTKKQIDNLLFKLITDSIHINGSKDILISHVLTTSSVIIAVYDPTEKGIVDLWSLNITENEKQKKELIDYSFMAKIPYDIVKAMFTDVGINNFIKEQRRPYIRNNILGVKVHPIAPIYGN